MYIWFFKIIHFDNKFVPAVHFLNTNAKKINTNEIKLLKLYPKKINKIAGEVPERAIPRARAPESANLRDLDPKSTANFLKLNVFGLELQFIKLIGLLWAFLGAVFCKGIYEGCRRTNAIFWFLWRLQLWIKSVGNEL